MALNELEPVKSIWCMVIKSQFYLKKSSIGIKVNNGNKGCFFPSFALRKSPPWYLNGIQPKSKRSSSFSLELVSPSHRRSIYADCIIWIRLKCRWWRAAEVTCKFIWLRLKVLKALYWQGDLMIHQNPVSLSGHLCPCTRGVRDHTVHGSSKFTMTADTMVSDEIYISLY